MKRYNIYIAVALFVLGVVIGLWSCRSYYVHKDADVQRDTIFVRDTFHYTKEKIVTKNVLVEKPCTTYVKVTDTLYKENTKYIGLPRQYYFSKVKDVGIYHSGIESTIDSLYFINTTANVYNTIIPKEKKHSLTIYGGLGYKDRFVTAPCGAKYLYHPATWFGVGGKYEYDVILETHAILATTEINFRW